MSHSYREDNALLAAYLEGSCTEAEAAQIRKLMDEYDDFRQFVAQLSSILIASKDMDASGAFVPGHVTQHAMSLFDSHATQPASMASIAIGMLNGLLRPLAEGMQPTLAAATSVRGEAAVDDELAYHVTLGDFSLSVELHAVGFDEVELSVFPNGSVPPGWTIRIIEGEQTRTLSSFSVEGVQVNALPMGTYTVALEHKQSREHQFHLSLVPDDID